MILRKQLLCIVNTYIEYSYELEAASPRSSIVYYVIYIFLNSMSGSIVGFIRNSEITSNYPRISFASCKRSKEAASRTSDLLRAL